MPLDAPSIPSSVSPPKKKARLDAAELVSDDEKKRLRFDLLPDIAHEIGIAPDS